MKRYLELCRFPAVFTALADVLLGFVLAGGTVDTPRDRLSLGLACSAGLYLGGMVLNDILDRRRDASERPGRPIPSGRVSVRAAGLFYFLLTSGGLLAAAGGGRTMLALAAAVATCVALYDGPLKRTPAGPAMMGACRFGNVLIGAAAGGAGWRLWAEPSLLAEPRVMSAAALLAVYITGLTVFARTEAVTSRRWRLVAGAVLVNAALVGVVAWSVVFRGGGRAVVALAGVGAIALVINRRLAAAMRSPQPPTVGRAVKLMILSIPVVDACLIAFAAGASGAGWAVACAMLVLPAATAGRVLKLT